MSNWIKVSPFAHHVDAVPNRPGVYAIYFGRELVYVGQSSNLRARFGNHRIKRGYALNVRTPWGEFPDTFKITAKVKVSRRLGDWAMWEIRLIHRLKPRFNVHLLKKHRDAA